MLSKRRARHHPQPAKDSIMKTSSHILVILLVGFGALAASAASPAQEATPDGWMNAPASKTRAEVQDELQQARRDGSIRFGAVDYDWAGRFVSAKTGGQVQAELQAARESGEYAMINDEAHGFSLPHTPRYAKAPH
jgi:hypothetical protein